MSGSRCRCGTSRICSSSAGSTFCHETVRMWWNRFGPMLAAAIRRQRVSRMRGFRHWRWHLDEVLREDQRRDALPLASDGTRKVKWLESYVHPRPRTRTQSAALHEENAERHGPVEAITTDGLRSFKSRDDRTGKFGQNRRFGKLGRTTACEKRTLTVSPTRSGPMLQVPTD